MDMKFWIELAVATVLALISWFMKREVDRIKADNDEVKALTIKQGEKITQLSDTLIEVKTVQDHCSTCQGREK